MSDCDRFEREGAAFLEHLSTCERCRAAQADYELLRESLADLETEDSPPEGWQARVRQEVKRMSPRQPWWQRVRARSDTVTAPGSLLPAALTAAAVLLIVVAGVPLYHLLSPDAAVQVALSHEIEEASGARRGGSEAQLGDRLRLSATVGDTAFAELRVYFNDAPLISVPSNTNRVEIVLTLSSVGTYRPVLILSDEPIPEAESTVDQDAGTILSHEGSRVELGESVRVR